MANTASTQRPALDREIALKRVARRRFEVHIWEMVVRIDPCLDVLRRLIVAGDMNGIPLAERAIAEYWEGTPPRARKSGLLYMQQILHEHRDALSREGRDCRSTSSLTELNLGVVRLGAFPTLTALD